MQRHARSILVLICCATAVHSFTGVATIGRCTTTTSGDCAVRRRLSPLYKQRNGSNSQSHVQDHILEQQETRERNVDAVQIVDTKVLANNLTTTRPPLMLIEEEQEKPQHEVESSFFTESTDTKTDSAHMRTAIRYAQSAGGERGEFSAYPNPTVGAVLVSGDGVIIGKGRSDYKSEAVRNCILNAGIEATPLSEWCVSWPSDPSLRRALKNATLYVTLEPSSQRHGSALPSTTNLIRETGIPRVVIGSVHPVHEEATKGAAALHAAGIQVSMIGDTDVQDMCDQLITEYAALQKNKLMCQARKHVQIFGRPLGFLHCSVVDSDNLEAFARHGNAFGTDFDGKNLGFRDFGSYEIAPPPEVSSE
jgi:pyrimidine deaminase RibD-like protein